MSGSTLASASSALIAATLAVPALAVDYRNTVPANGIERSALASNGPRTSAIAPDGVKPIGTQFDGVGSSLLKIELPRE